MARALALLAALLAACAKPPADLAVAKGSVVKLHVTLKAGGKTIDTTRDKGPLVLTEGSRQVLAGLEDKLLGMKVGEKKTFQVPPSKAYGPVNPRAFLRVARASFSDPHDVVLGHRIRGQLQGQAFQASVYGFDDQGVVLDLNHPLAGKTLTFEVEVVDLLPPTAH